MSSPGLLFVHLTNLHRLAFRRNTPRPRSRLKVNERGSGRQQMSCTENNTLVACCWWALSCQGDCADWHRHQSYFGSDAAPCRVPCSARSARRRGGLPQPRVSTRSHDLRQSSIRTLLLGSKWLNLVAEGWQMAFCSKEIVEENESQWSYLTEIPVKAAELEKFESFLFPQIRYTVQMNNCKGKSMSGSLGLCLNSWTRLSVFLLLCLIFTLIK